MVGVDITDINPDPDIPDVADIGVGGDCVRGYGMFKAGYTGYKKALQYRSRMAYYRDYYRNTGKHHNTKYYYGFKYWR